MTVKTNENAELSMRVKALEADVAALQRQNARLIEAIDQLRQEIADVRARARLAY